MSIQATPTPQLPPPPPGYDLELQQPTDPLALEKGTVPTKYTISTPYGPVPVYAPGALGATVEGGAPGGAATAALPPPPPGYDQPVTGAGPAQPPQQPPQPTDFLSNLAEGARKIPLAAGAGLYDAAAFAGHVTANVSDLLDKAAGTIASITGTTKGDAFKNIADWSNQQAAGAQQTAEQISGGRQDLESQIIRGVTGGAMQMPIVGSAAALGGPILGLAGLGAISQEDRGFLPALEGAVSGALTGGAFHFLGPAGQIVRIPLSGLLGYIQSRFAGNEPAAALKDATTMGLLSVPGAPGGLTAREIVSSIPQIPRALIETLPITRSTYDPVKQSAINALSSQGVPLTAGMLTGNRYLRAIEATTAHTPLGAEAAQEFHAGTGEALASRAEQLAGEISPHPETPYSAGQFARDALNKQIADLDDQEQSAYETAWQHAGNPQYTKEVQVGTKLEPVMVEGKRVGSKRVPVYDEVNMPVDVRWMKSLARNQIPKYELSLSRAELAQSSAYGTLTKILDMPDHISAEQAEEALKGLKGETRGAESPNLRNVAQGTAASIIPRLQMGVDAAVRETGQDSVEGLQNGRRLHAEKMQKAEMLRKLRKEPTQAFGQLTQGRDTGVDFLNQMAEHSPELMPVLGRAWMDETVRQATQEGGWERALGILRRWQDLGERTRALIIPNAAQRQALNRFFLGQKLIAAQINPSGTELTRTAKEATTNPLKWFTGWIGSKLLFTPQGIRLLTGVMENPPRTAAEGARVRAEAAKIAGPPEEPPEEPPEGTPPEGGGPPPPPAPTGGGAAAQPARENEPAHGQEGRIGGDTLVYDRNKGHWVWPENLSPAPEPGTPASGGGGGKSPTTIGDIFTRPDDVADAALDRMRRRGTFSGTRLTSGIPPEDLADMAVWGAAKLVKGAQTFGDWSRDMLQQFGQAIRPHLGALWQRASTLADFTKHLPPPEAEPVSPLKPLQPVEVRRGNKLAGSLPELRRAAERKPGVGGPDNERTVLSDDNGQFVIGKITPEDWIERVNKNLSADEMVKARNWYRELQGFFEQHFGKEEGPKMALAWLSSQQNVSPSGGMTNVLRALDEIRGMPKEKTAGLAEAKILAALRSEAPEGGYGAKLNDFVDSAMGKRTRTWMGDDPRGGQPAVIDVWANRDVGKIDQKVYDYLTNRFGADATKDLKIDGKSVGDTDYEYGSRFYNQLVDHLNKIGYDGGGWTGDQVQAVGWTAMQKAMGAKPEFASDLITKNTRQYAYETQPGEGSPLLQQYPWHTLSIDQQAKVSDYVGSRVTDLAAKLTGAKITNRVVTRGAYLGKPTISIQMNVFASPETFRDFTRAAGYLGQQSEVWNIRPLKSGNTWAWFIRGAKGLDTPEAQQTFWQKLSDRVGANLVPGYSPMGGEAGNGVLIANPFSKQYLFERQKAGFKPDPSLRPWTAGDKAKIQDGIEAVAGEMGLDLDVDFDKVDLGASLHNWARKGKQNGHLQRLIETGRSAISDQLSRHAPESVQSWWKEAWDQFAGGDSGGTAGAQGAAKEVRPAPPKRGNRSP